jgi:hypothetical protein
VKALSLLLTLLLSSIAGSQTSTPSKEVRELVSVDAPVVVLRHARVIDGMGGPVGEEQLPPGVTQGLPK